MIDSQAEKTYWNSWKLSDNLLYVLAFVNWVQAQEQSKWGEKLVKLFSKCLAYSALVVYTSKLVILLIKIIVYVHSMFFEGISFQNEMYCSPISSFNVLEMITFALYPIKMFVGYYFRNAVTISIMID